MSKNSPATRSDKRARFAGESRKKQGRVSPLVIIGAVLAVIVATVVIGIATRGGGQSAAAADAGRPAGALPGNAVDVSSGSLAVAVTSGHAPYPLAEAHDGAAPLPLSTFDDGQAHFYAFSQQGQTVEFFVIKDEAGHLHTALNACDVCYPAKKGYHQEGDEMVCNNCGRRFPVDQVGLVSGGCNPSPLKATVEGDTLVIQVQDLLAGVIYF